MTKYFLTLFAFIVLLSACVKSDNFDPAKQAQTDDQLITDYLAKNNLTAQKHSSGLYYIVSAPGTGTFSYTANTNVTAKYTGRFLNGNVFDSSSTGITFPLGGVIPGWQIGVPLIQKGGKIRLFIPSSLGYGRDGAGSIPGNAVLDFDIELVNVN